jgi:glycosyltransferase involved in cell wall biosynthesis
VRTKNNNWGGVVNYAIKHVKTKYVKILDADDSFFTNDLQSYFESLQHISKTDCDIIINSYAIHDIKNNALMKRYYNLYNKTVFTNFDKRFFVKIITMHAMT